MIEAYKNYWIGFTDFKGRTNVKGYWLAVLGHFLVNLALNIIVILLGRYNSRQLILICIGPFQIISMLPSLAIMVRRLSDAGYSWTNLFWTFLPIAGPILLIIRLCKPTVTFEGNEPYPYNYSKYQELGLLRILSGLLLLWAALIVIAPAIIYRVFWQMNIFWWISRISLISLAVFILLGKKNYGLLISAGLVALLELRLVLTEFQLENLLTLIGWGSVFLLIWFAVKEQKVPSTVLMYLPMGIFLVLSFNYFVHWIRNPDYLYRVFADLLRVASIFCLGKMLLADSNDKPVNDILFRESPPPVPQPDLSANSIGNNKKIPGVLLVRFSIDKLNDLSGSYGYQSGKLIGMAVPADLLEGMTISDGDSAATLSGQEYVCLVSIASDDISVLRNKIEPLIRKSTGIIENGANPVTQIVSSTGEPLVIDGVVRNGKIVGSGGWCANGFMAAWKEAAENSERVPDTTDVVETNGSVIEGGGTIMSGSAYREKPVINYGSHIFSILFSGVLIMAGASGEFVLIGTNSSSALVLVGLAYLVLDILSIINSYFELKKYEQEQSARAAAMRKEEQKIMDDTQKLSERRTVRLTCDSNLQAMKLVPRLNGTVMAWDANASEFTGFTSSVQNIINFNDVDLTAVFEIVSNSGDIVIELFHDMAGIGMKLPNHTLIVPRENQ